MAVRELHISNQIKLITFVSVISLLGQQVVTLVGEEKAAGRYEVNWNASGFASGVYFYQLQAGQFVETKKMVVAR